VRTLGIDLGRSRIGLALADEVLRTAAPLSVVKRTREAADLAAIQAAVAEYEVTRIVLGLPLNMDGTEGASAKLARRFQATLEGALGIAVELFDERLSTFEAAGRLRERGVTARGQKERIDAEAAAVILQGWLDRKGP
jgi:putative Holliday junction resolvase